jgi:hypothetical protein
MTEDEEEALEVLAGVDLNDLLDEVEEKVDNEDIHYRVYLNTYNLLIDLWSLEHKIIGVEANEVRMDQIAYPKAFRPPHIKDTTYREVIDKYLLECKKAAIHIPEEYRIKVGILLKQFEKRVEKLNGK